MKSITQVVENLIKPYIDSHDRTAEAIIAPVETDATSASDDYTVGKQLILNNVLYDVIAPITAGDALVVNTNIKAADNVSSDIGAKQPKTLDTPITVGGVQQTTVEGALGSINQTLTNEVEIRERFNVDNLIETTLSGSHDYNELTYVVNNDKSITVTVNSTLAEDRNIPIVNGWDGFDISSYIGEKLVISGANSLFSLMIIILDSSNQELAQITCPEQGNTITVPSGAKYCRVVLSIKEGTTPQTYTYYPRLSVALTNQEITEKIDVIGTKVQGTKSSVALPNGGVETTVATMTLDKGKWIIIASGYSPMDLITYSNEATTIKIHGIGGYWGIPLSYMFNMMGVAEVNADNTSLTLDVTNWESSAVSESTTNFAFDAYRLI